jgi:hypothetical protein
MGQRQYTEHTPIDPVIGAGLRHIVGIKGVAGSPEEIDLTKIIPTIDMAMGGNARLLDNVNVKSGYVNYSFNGLASATFYILEYGGTRTQAGSCLYDVGYNFAPIALSYLLQIPQAIRDVYNGHFFSATLILDHPGSPMVGHDLWSGIHQIKAGEDGYWTYSGADWWQHDIATVGGVYNGQSAGASTYGRIPLPRALSAGCRLLLRFLTLGDPLPAENHWVFPAIDIYVKLLGQQVPIGAPIPGIW